MPPSEGTQSLWRNFDFVCYWVASALGTVATSLPLIALPLLVFERTGSASATAGLAAVNTLFYVGFGPVGGVLADSYSRKTILGVCSLALAALFASIPVAFSIEGVGLPWLYAVSAATAMVNITRGGAGFGAITSIAGAKRLVEARSALGSTNATLDLIAPAASGALLVAVGTDLGLALTAGLLALGAAATWAIRADLGGGARAQTMEAFWVDLREGFAFTLREPTVRAQTIVNVAYATASGVILGSLVVYAVRGLGLETNDARIGFLFAATGVGALASNVGLPRLYRSASVGSIALGSIVVGIVSMLAMAAAPGFLFGLIAVAVWAMARTLVIANSDLARQRVTPNRLLGRVSTAGRTLSLAGQPLGAALGGVLADGLGVRVAVVAAAAVAALSILAWWRSPLRTGLPEQPGREATEAAS